MYKPMPREELQLIRKNLQAAADFLEGVEYIFSVSTMITRHNWEVVIYYRTYSVDSRRSVKTLAGGAEVVSSINDKELRIISDILILVAARYKVRFSRCYLSKNGEHATYYMRSNYAAYSEANEVPF